MIRPVGLIEAATQYLSKDGYSISGRAGTRKALRRHLPYPFDTYFTIASDCDAPNMEGFLNTGRILREQYALPVSDSFFPEWIYERSRKTNGKPPDIQTLIGENAAWIRGFHLGWTDVVHGWLAQFMLKIGEDVNLHEPWLEAGLFRKINRLWNSYSSNRLWLRLPRKLTRRKARIHFHIPDGWHVRRPPRYFFFRYRMPVMGSSAKLSVMDGDTEIAHVILDDSTVGGHLKFNDYVLDLHSLIGNDQGLLHRIAIEFEITGHENTLEVRDPCLLSAIRANIMEHMNILACLNLRATVYTSHGGGYNIGQRTVSNSAAADKRGIAENSRSPQYALDLFKSYGLEFFNTASNTADIHDWPIEELVFPTVLNNGSTVYDFHRYSYVPRDEMGIPDYSIYTTDEVLHDPSMAEFTGVHINGALDSIRKPGNGGILYTHLIARSLADPRRMDRSNDGLFDDLTHEALASLARHYYGSDSVSRRVYVAPTSILVRMSQVCRCIDDHSCYDPVRNIVYIEQWYDPVTERMVPDLRYGARELRGLTFYVDDAATARLFINEHEFDCLIRNPSDETGNQSITVADIESSRVLLGRLSLNERKSWLMTCEKAFISDQKEGIGTEINITKNVGSVKFSPSGIRLANRHALAIKVSKSDPEVSYEIILETADGLMLKAREGESDESDDTFPISTYQSTEPRLVIIPFYLWMRFANKYIHPVADLTSVTINVYGNTGDQLLIHYIHLLRDCDLPNISTACVIGGYCPPEMGVSEIELQDNFGRYSALVGKEGYYVFRHRVRRGNIVKITAKSETGKLVEPCEGKNVEILSDTLDIDF